MFLRSFVKNNLLFRIMDPLKRKSPVATIPSLENSFGQDQLSSYDNEAC